MDKQDSDLSQELRGICKGLCLQNIVRIFSVLEKALERLARKHWHNRSQYPNFFLKSNKASKHCARGFGITNFL